MTNKLFLRYFCTKLQKPWGFENNSIFSSTLYFGWSEKFVSVSFILDFAPFYD